MIGAGFPHYLRFSGAGVGVGGAEWGGQPIRAPRLARAGTESVDAEQTRLARAGLVATDQRATTCCYATQDKFWVQGAPGGESWEIYTVLEDSSTFYEDDIAAAARQAGTEPAGAGSAVCCGGAQEPGDPATAPAARCC